MRQGSQTPLASSTESLSQSCTQLVPQSGSQMSVCPVVPANRPQAEEQQRALGLLSDKHNKPLDSQSYQDGSMSPTSAVQIGLHQVTQLPSTLPKELNQCHGLMGTQPMHVSALAGGHISQVLSSEAKELVNVGEHQKLRFDVSMQHSADQNPDLSIEFKKTSENSLSQQNIVHETNSYSDSTNLSTSSKEPFSSHEKAQAVSQTTDLLSNQQTTLSGSKFTNEQQKLSDVSGSKIVYQSLKTSLLSESPSETAVTSATQVTDSTKGFIGFTAPLELISQSNAESSSNLLTAAQQVSQKAISRTNQIYDGLVQPLSQLASPLIETRAPVMVFGQPTESLAERPDTKITSQCQPLSSVNTAAHSDLPSSAVKLSDSSGLTQVQPNKEPYSALSYELEQVFSASDILKLSPIESAAPAEIPLKEPHIKVPWMKPPWTQKPLEQPNKPRPLKVLIEQSKWPQCTSDSPTSLANAFGPGLGLCPDQPVLVDQATEFTIDLSRLASTKSPQQTDSASSVEVVIQGPKEPDSVVCADRGDGTLGVMYVPRQVGKYVVSLVHADQTHLPGSPFVVAAYPADRSHLSTDEVVTYGLGVGKWGMRPSEGKWKA
ncbi:unnamed protein product [Protopolystoma xenopodis]|uniref:Filamin n=1 Tax=Protopolystoma xenopodis TaxID=117903 RepID=A0A448WDP6_9PLAT|nr:unnamed protein product [Protopolystoma xenopodis]